MEGVTTANTPKMDWSSGDLPGAWRSFKQHCEFTFGGPLKGKTEEQRCNYLMIWVGDKGRDIYNTWTLADKAKKKLQTYYDKFEAYVKPKSNHVFARYKFHNKVQQEGEPFDQFLTDLQLLVKDCGYQDPDEMVRDRVVIGCRSQKSREKLIQEGSGLTLEQAVDIARTQEISSAQLQTMAGEDPKVQAVETSYTQWEDRSKRSRRDKERKSTECTRCGSTHGKSSVCPALGRKCGKCNKPNHFAKVCQTKLPKNMHFVQESSSDEELYVGCLDTVNAVDMSEWYEEIMIPDKVVKFQLDTGARCNVMSLTTFHKLGIKAEFTKSAAQLKSYSGHVTNVRGVTTMPCQYKDKLYQVKFYIADCKVPAVLSAATCKEMELVSRIHTVTSTSKDQQADTTSPVSSVTHTETKAKQTTTSEPHQADTPDILQEYSDLFQGLGCLPGEHTIKIDPAVPPVVHPPRKVPVALKGKIKDELDRMEEAGVIVRQTEPTEWVSTMVTVIKPSKIRICIDPRDLNQAIKREHYPMKTIEEVVAEIPGAKVFSTLDARSGFWQIKLDEASSKLCTFNSPFGRYRFTRLPFGIKSAPEVFQKSMSNLFEDIKGAKPIVDDILVWGQDVKEHYARLRQVLDRSREANLKFNPQKCHIRKEAVPYIGHVLTKDRLIADPEKIRAVQEMRQPQNAKELRTFLGFMQYLAKFMPNMADVSSPLRQLLEKEVEWHWEKEQEESFQKLKLMASSTPVLGYHDPDKPVTLSMDASSKGLGAVVLQEDKPIAYASRALTSAQEKYAQIEKETLAIVYGAQKFHQYLYGKQVMVQSDHKPLEVILNKPLHQAPLRLQKMMLSLQRYDLKVKFKPGAEMNLADALSRAFLPETKETLVPDLEVNEVNLTAHLPISPERYLELQKATANDSVMQVLQDVVLEGWPDKRADVPLEIRQYWTFREEISCIDGLLFKGQKLIVPQALRAQMLEKIHESHQGIVKSKQRARDLLFWPGMMTQIEEQVAKCFKCSQYQTAHAKEPMIITETPERPWSKIAADLFEYQGNSYLLCVDYYSKWIEVDKLDDLTSRNTISYLKSQFSRHGIPDQLITDNGSQFTSSEFNAFTKCYGFEHTTSSPHYPQANGEVERAVQTVKTLLKKGADPYQALLNYRNTPLERINLSPAQLLMGRRLKTTLPTTAALLRPQSAREIKHMLEKMKEKEKQQYNRHCGRELPSLHTGDVIRMQHGKQWKAATVLYKHSSPRSYVVQAPDGTKYRRNRRHLHVTRAPATIASEDTAALDKRLAVQPMDSTSSLVTNTSANNNKVSQTRTREESRNDLAAPLEPPVMTQSEAEVVKTRSGRTVKTPSHLCDFKL